MEDLCGNLDHDRASDRGSLCEVPGKMDSGDRILVGRLDGGHIFGLSFPVHVLHGWIKAMCRDPNMHLLIFVIG